MHKRVYENSSNRCSQAFQHAINHGHKDQGFGSVRSCLVILAEAAVSSQPGKGPFHDPAFGAARPSLVPAGLYGLSPAPSGCVPPPRCPMFRRIRCRLTADSGSGNKPAIRCRTSLASSRSRISAGCTNTASSQPCVSTTMCRLPPSPLLPAPYPLGPPCSVVFTL